LERGEGFTGRDQSLITPRKKKHNNGEGEGEEIWAGIHFNRAERELRRAGQSEPLHARKVIVSVGAHTISQETGKQERSAPARPRKFNENRLNMRPIGLNEKTKAKTVR